MNLVLDGNLVLGWCFEDRATEYSDRVLQEVVKVGGVIPAFVMTHLADILIDAERRGRLSQKNSGELIGLLFNLPVDVEALSDELAVTQVQSLARIHRLSAYEATYLYQASRDNRLLASDDTTLLEAARIAGVPVFE